MKDRENGANGPLQEPDSPQAPGNNEEPDRYKLVAWISGLALILCVLAITFLMNQLSEFQQTILIIVLALAAAGFALFITGSIEVKLPVAEQFHVSAVGPLAVFVLVLFVGLKVGGPEESPPPDPKPKLPSLTASQVFQQHYNQLSDEKQGTRKQHFNSLLSIFTQEGRKLFEPDEKVAGPIGNHLAVYFEGSSHFLKLQRYPLPAGARSIRAAAVSTDTKPQFFIKNPTWVATRKDGAVKFFEHRRDDRGYYWSVAPVASNTEVFIATVYRNGTPVRDDGIMDIWVEVGDLTEEFETLTVVFANDGQALNYQSAYQFNSDGQVRFYPIGHERSERLSGLHSLTLETFDGIIQQMLASNLHELKDQELLEALWAEYHAQSANTVEAIRLHNVTQDVLVVVTAN